MNLSRSSFFVLCVFGALVSTNCKQSRSGTTTPEPAPPLPAPKPIERKSQPTPAPTIPELPVNADSLPEITVKLSLTHGEHRIVSRTKDRVHLAMPDRNQEWLFIRNPVDGRRVSGILIDHSHKVRIDYPESDLRIEGVARGWADLIDIDQRHGEVTPGVDKALLEDPRKRFPDYGDFDIADWREELHEHEHDHGEHPAPTAPKH